MNAILENLTRLNENIKLLYDALKTIEKKVDDLTIRLSNLELNIEQINTYDNTTLKLP